MKFARVSAMLLLSFSAVACAAPVESGDASSEEDVTGTSYVDAMEWNGSSQQDGVYELGRRVGDELAASCGSTFCKGAYTNLTSLQFACSVSSVKGSVKECVWILAGSQDAIDATSGAVNASVPSFQCVYSPKTTLPKLLAALSPATGRAIDVTLPGTSGSLADGLAACLAKPIGATSITTTKPAAPKYYPVESILSSKNLATWKSAVGALDGSFLDICGDTFCGSDYGNLTPLALACSATSNDTIGSCKWLFAGSYATVTATTGHVNVSAKSFQCGIPVTGLATTYAKALTAAGNEPAIQRHLPNKTTSTYDALGGCLP
jgi:hypothetical protein